MTQPYREGGLACPSCRLALRVFGTRLVCDHCGGIMLAVADFGQAVADVGGEQPTITDDASAASPCPRCDQPMQACRISSGGIALDHAFQHCERDGLWLDGGILDRVFEEISHRSRAGAAGGRSLGGTIRRLDLGFGTQGMSTAFNAVGDAFAQASLIRTWWEKPRPRVHIPFASTLAGRELPCPECRTALVLHGNLWGCPEHGVFVENAAIEAMVTEMTNQPWQLPAPAGSPGARICPACAEPLMVETLESVTVDRCAAHGVWFDPSELQATLRHAAEPHGWFRRLFS